VRRRPELDDFHEEERAYSGDVFEQHDCSAVEELGDQGPEATRAPRRERPRMTAGKQRARLKRHTCACQPPRILRAATTDLTDLECPRCSTYFVWAPSPSELSDDELAGRIPA
jgi:hypothetical protein